MLYEVITLLKAADILEKRQMDFVNALIDEGGAWIGKGMFETGYVPGIFRAAAAAVYQMTGEILPSDHGKVSIVITSYSIHYTKLYDLISNLTTRAYLQQDPQSKKYQLGMRNNFV